jgi:hypothetical protein
VSGHCYGFAVDHQCEVHQISTKNCTVDRDMANKAIFDLNSDKKKARL